MTQTRRARPLLIHATTTDVSLDWLLGPQLRAFVAAGYDVIGMSAPGPHTAAVRALGVDHLPLPTATRRMRPLADIRTFVAMYRAFRRLRPDIVHTHTPKVGVLGRTAARAARVPLVVNTQHGLYAQPTDRRRRRWPVYTIERLAAACSHLELVQSAEDVATLVHTLKVPAHRVIHLGNGIDLDRFSTPAAAARDAVRAQWGIDATTVVVGTVGRLVAEKGLAELCVMAGNLTDDVAVVVVGPNDEVSSGAIDDDVLKHAVAAGVQFVGARTDMPDVYAAFDIYVTASHREGMPRAVIEASAMGLPVVATNIRGCREVVADGETGCLVAVHDGVALADAVRRLVGDPATRVAMGQAGARRANAHFDQRAVIATTLDAYGRARSWHGTLKR